MPCEEREASPVTLPSGTASSGIYAVATAADMLLDARNALAAAKANVEFLQSVLGESGSPPVVMDALEDVSLSLDRLMNGVVSWCSDRAKEDERPTSPPLRRAGRR